MKLIILTALVAAVTASGGSGYNSGPSYGSSGSGYNSHQDIDYYAVPDYSTAHAVKDAYSGVDIDSQENRLADRTEGSYSTLLPDGRKQVVTYWVDGNSGFNADVQYYGQAQHPQGSAGYGGYGAH